MSYFPPDQRGGQDVQATRTGFAVTNPRFNFRQRGPLRRYRGLGDDNDPIGQFVNMFNQWLPTVTEIQATADAQAKAEVDQTIAKLTGGTDRPAQTTPITQTVNGTSAPGSADFVVSGSSCKPRNKPALDAAKSLQVQLNRAGRAMGAGTITVDGEIGPQTISLLGRVSPGVLPTGASCQTITSQLSFLLSTVQSIADAAGAPPPSQQELAGVARAGVMTVPTTGGKSFAFKPPGVQASLMDKVKNLPDTTKIILGGVALLGGVFAFKKLRARRGASSPAPAALPAAPVSNPRRRRRRRR